MSFIDLFCLPDVKLVFYVVSQTGIESFMSTRDWHSKLVCERVEAWAERFPGRISLIEWENGNQIMYKQLADMIHKYAVQLLLSGYKPGDRIALSMDMSPRFIAMLFACWKVGMIAVPVKMNLDEPEESLQKLVLVEPRAWFLLDLPAPLPEYECTRFMELLPSVNLFVSDSTFEQTHAYVCQSWDQWLNSQKTKKFFWKSRKFGKLTKIQKNLHAWQPAWVCFKSISEKRTLPILLCHENIIIQHTLMVRATAEKEHSCSWIGNEIEDLSTNLLSLISVLLSGGKIVLSKSNHADNIIQAVHRYQISRLILHTVKFEAIWRSPSYHPIEFKSLTYAIYLDAPSYFDFQQKLEEIAPAYGTGFFQEEAGGFATFYALNRPDRYLAENELGVAYETIGKVSIREPMNPGGGAGTELPDGQLGDICCHPPLVFSGYYQQPELTSQILSREGILYTGFLGFFKQIEGRRVLILVGENKLPRNNDLHSYPQPSSS
ncbi:MAG: AMP-binding protein, partial [Bacteroidota bacterium]